MRAKAIVPNTTPAPNHAEPINAGNWLDLKIGQRCTIECVLESTGYGSPGTLLVRFGDWSTLVIDCEEPRAMAPIGLSARINVRAERTEDGLLAIAAWEEGSVPIPLITRR